MKNNPKELADDLKVIRTIHSNKARVYSNYNSVYLFITVVVSVIVAFIGFTGPEALFNLEGADGIKAINILNIMILVILIISILGLIFRFEHKMNKHNRAVVRLTEFIAEISFSYLLDKTTSSVEFRTEDLKSYSEKYKSLISSLPATKDKDYFYALKTIKKKKKIKAFIASDEYDKRSFFTRWIHILCL